jgi:hypothetical protein
MIQIGQKKIQNENFYQRGFLTLLSNGKMRYQISLDAKLVKTNKPNISGFMKLFRPTKIYIKKIPYGLVIMIGVAVFWRHIKLQCARLSEIDWLRSVSREKLLTNLPKKSRNLKYVHSYSKFTF